VRSFAAPEAGFFAMEAERSETSVHLRRPRLAVAEKDCAKLKVGSGSAAGEQGE
jgi:hypothetical protein